MGTVWVAGVSRQGGRDRAGGDVTLPSLVCWSQWARARWGQRGQQSPSPEAAAADTHTDTQTHDGRGWRPGPFTRAHSQLQTSALRMGRMGRMGRTGSHVTGASPLG